MTPHKTHWYKAFFWGGVTAALYAAMFYNSDVILHLAHTTPASCVVGAGPDAEYFHNVDATACAAAGGRLEAGNWQHVLVPILLAFAISYVHGAFTGLFWELMGLKPAGHQEK